jgi:alpha/beta superfamily hydrolase
LSLQKNIEIKFEQVQNANHFFKNKEKELSTSIDSYIKDKVTIV